MQPGPAYSHSGWLMLVGSRASSSAPAAALALLTAAGDPLAMPSVLLQEADVAGRTCMCTAMLLACKGPSFQSAPTVPLLGDLSSSPGSSKR